MKKGKRAKGRTLGKPLFLETEREANKED